MPSTAEGDNVTTVSPASASFGSSASDAGPAPEAEESVAMKFQLSGSADDHAVLGEQGERRRASRPRGESGALRISVHAGGGHQGPRGSTSSPKASRVVGFVAAGMADPVNAARSRFRTNRRAYTRTGNRRA